MPRLLTRQIFRHLVVSPVAQRVRHQVHAQGLRVALHAVVKATVNPVLAVRQKQQYFITVAAPATPEQLPRLVEGLSELRSTVRLNSINSLRQSSHVTNHYYCMSLFCASPVPIGKAHQPELKRITPTWSLVIQRLQHFLTMLSYYNAIRVPVHMLPLLVNHNHHILGPATISRRTTGGSAGRSRPGTTACPATACRRPSPVSRSTGTLSCLRHYSFYAIRVNCVPTMLL